MVDFVNLGKLYKDMDLSGLENIVHKGQFVGGPALEEFEANFAAYCGTKHAVGVGSGTDALVLSLLALGVGPGDNVIVPANTFIATAMAVTHTGARVVFADVDLQTFNIDVADADAKINKRTKAIIPVHLYGNPCDMRGIRKLAKKYRLSVVEDCAQATGATYADQKVGSFGDAGCFSFYPTKNLGGLGQGGMITTDCDRLAEKVRVLGNVGRKTGSWYEYERVGFNSRLDNVNAWFLNENLKKLDEWNALRRLTAERYVSLFENYRVLVRNYFPVRTQLQNRGKNVFHLFVVCVPPYLRDRLTKYLNERGVNTGLHYPIPCHKQSIYEDEAQWLVNTEKLADTILSLPMYPGITMDEVTRVFDCMVEFFQGQYDGTNDELYVD